jgi:hypothetical protein
VEWNRDQAAVLVLITGRILAVREYRHRFCRESREGILHALPYYLPKSQIEHDFEKDSQELLTIDQRDEWWRQYGQACGRDFPGLPEELRQKKLDELTSRPILNHLMAQLYRDGRLQLSGESNINSVYYQMIQAIYDRGWEPRRPHNVTKDMYLDQFFRTLEEIAVAAWHGDRRRAQEADIRNRLARIPPLKDILDSLEKREGGKAVSRLLTGFFFGPGDEGLQVDRTYEFTHKSFGEYLFAQSLIRLLKNIHYNYAANQSDDQRGWDARHCLDAWAELCGPSPIDQDLSNLLYNELMLLKNDHPVASWQETLANLIAFMLAQGMYGEALPAMSYQDLCRQACNAEMALLAVLNACARVTENVSIILWPSKSAAGAWLARLVGDRNSVREFALACLSFLDLSGQWLNARDLAWANLHRSNLRWTQLMYANLRESDLRGADLREAIPFWANLTGADLSEADLSGADLMQADLSDANLQEVTINEATRVNDIRIDADTKFTKGSKLDKLLKKAGITPPAKTARPGPRRSR